MRIFWLCINGVITGNFIYLRFKAFKISGWYDYRVF